MQSNLKFFLSLIFFFPLLSLAQENDFPKDDFKPPVDFNMALSGTFGELRTNHFHSGIDIKTFGATGKPLMAIADGFVSRVAVSPGGFGHAVYIEHPNGYTSVFAHCKSFSPALAQWVKTEQYRLESFQVNLFPEKNQFQVKQGEVIAYSGNSGSSMGPHLHFEIRKTLGQTPVNPLLFNYDVRDFIRPTINGLKIFPVGKYSFVDGKNKVATQSLAGWGPEYKLKTGDTLKLSGQFYFGINTYDKLNDANNKNGVYSIQFYIDSTLVYAHALEMFDFTESRYVNSLIDYKGYVKQKSRYQKTYIEPNNKLSIYREVSGNGIFSFIDDNYHQLKYVVKDANGNESILKFTVKSNPPQFKNIGTENQVPEEIVVFNWDDDNYFETKDFSISVPKGALYDTLKFEYTVSPEVDEGFYSPLHEVGNPGKAIQNRCKLSIKPLDFPEELKSKALIVRVDKRPISAGGSWDGEFLTSNIRNFGSYSISVDTISPEIIAKNIQNAKNVSQQSTIKFTIKDDFSGIRDYRATLNGEWLLMEWDPKNSLLVYRIDDRLKAGENHFELQVTDAVGNEAKYEALLKR